MMPFEQPGREHFSSAMLSSHQEDSAEDDNSHKDHSQSTPKCFDPVLRPLLFESVIIHTVSLGFLSSARVSVVLDRDSRNLHVVALHDLVDVVPAGLAADPHVTVVSHHFPFMT